MQIEQGQLRILGGKCRQEATEETPPAWTNKAAKVNELAIANLPAQGLRMTPARRLGAWIRS